MASGTKYIDRLTFFLHVDVVGAELKVRKAKGEPVAYYVEVEHSGDRVDQGKGEVIKSEPES